MESMDLLDLMILRTQVNPAQIELDILWDQILVCREITCIRGQIWQLNELTCYPTIELIQHEIRLNQQLEMLELKLKFLGQKLELAKELSKTQSKIEIVIKYLNRIQKSDIPNYMYLRSEARQKKLLDYLKEAIKLKKHLLQEIQIHQILIIDKIQAEIDELQLKNVRVIDTFSEIFK